MQFLSFTFLWAFFPLCFVLYWIMPKSFRGYVLLAANIGFYAYADARGLLILASYILLSYFASIFVSSGTQKRRKTIMVITFGITFSTLFLFKYMGWVSGGINLLVSGDKTGPIHVPAWILPLGISFYLFTGTGYVIDVYRGKYAPIRNFIKYAAFISFFPTITSGPIQRAENWVSQFEPPTRLTYSRIKKALLLFLWGAFLKMIIADRIAGFVDMVYASYLQYHGYVMLLAVLGYSIQIYADFAGYSYMAIGISCAFGFELPDNFRQPHLAGTIADFWRRWHISLTSWFRDYLYIPLGGNRKGDFRKYINIMIVFLISGLWHGAGITFVLWGGYMVFTKLLEELPGRGARACMIGF